MPEPDPNPHHSPPDQPRPPHTILGEHYLTAPAVWPPTGTPSPYVLQPSEANLWVHTLVLPDNFQIVLPPGWNQPLNWTTDEFDFGAGTTISLAVQPWQAQAGGNGGPPAPQPDVGQNGAAGAGGGTGYAAASATSLTLSAATIVTSGSLWIQTDGQAGGAGGSGGRGQDGGGGSCGQGILHTGTSAGNAGGGGNGGGGGNRGATAAGPPHIPMTSIHGTKGCGAAAPSVRPNGLTGTISTIAVYGAPGAGGPGGSGAPGGIADHQERDCGVSHAHGGQDGAAGGGGSAGVAGACILPVLVSQLKKP